jgi:hypothetical protein
MFWEGFPSDRLGRVALITGTVAAVGLSLLGAVMDRSGRSRGIEVDVVQGAGNIFGGDVL